MKNTCLLSFFFFVLFQVGNAQVNYIQDVYAFLGDYGSGDEDEDSVSKLIKSWNPDAIITLGDNNYPNGNAIDIDKNIGKYYHDYIKPYSGFYGPAADKNRFWPSLGNHDLMTFSGGPYFNYFQLPNNERYYDFVIGDLHFFCLNSDPSELDGTTETSIQGTWLKNKLQTSSAKWKIVYGHYSPYSSDAWYGNHQYMQWPFKDWGADIVISGHAHLYERLTVNSFPYIVCGLGGQSKYNFATNPEPGSQVRYNDKYGALQLRAKPDTLWFRFYTVNNNLIDSFFLFKSQVGISENEQRLRPKIYPNPNTGEMSIDFDADKIPIGPIQISIMGVLGNEFYSESFTFTAGSHRKNISLPESIRGIIFLQLSSEKSHSNTKVVINR